MGDFNCSVSWSKPPDVEGCGPSGLHLVLRGCDFLKQEVLKWPRHTLKIGDAISIEIMDFCEATSEPERIKPTDGREERHRRSVRAAAKELGWRILEPPSSANPLPAHSAEPTPWTQLSTANIELSQIRTPSFQVSVNSQKLAIVGLRGQSHVICCVEWSMFTDATEGKCLVWLGGYDRSTKEFLEWPKRSLRMGDTVAIEIVDFREPIPAPERKLAETPEDVEMKKSYVRKAAKELGWVVAEEPEAAPVSGPNRHSAGQTRIRKSRKGVVDP